MPSDFSNLPALPPPPGVVSDFVHPHTRAKETIAISAICLSLMFPIVIMRLYSRLWIARSFRGDDGEPTLSAILRLLADHGQLLAYLRW